MTTPADQLKADVAARGAAASQTLAVPNDGSIAAASKRSQAAASNDPRVTIKREIELYAKHVGRALPSSYEGGSDRFIGSVLNAIRTDRTGKLITCSPVSIVGAALHSAQLGLEIGPLGEAYLVPRGGQCTFEPGWKGLRKLAFQGGIDIIAKAIRDTDQFDQWWDEKGPHLMFRPALGTGGKVVAYFGLAKPVTGGMPDVLVVDQSWIDARRKAGGGNSSAWKEWPEEMALKTVVKALANAAPKSTRSERLALAIASDGVVRTELDGTPDEHATAYADDDVVDGEVID